MAFEHPRSTHRENVELRRANEILRLGRRRSIGSGRGISVTVAG
jgi:hypothetical protein